MPKVSVIIPTRNSEKYLKQVLESVSSQKEKDVEIIIVDNNSTDNTKEISLQFGVTFLTKGPERSVQKNFASTKAVGKYLLFLDSDAVLTPNVLSECVFLSEKSNFSMIIIPEKHIGIGFWAKAKALEREVYLGDDTIECPWFFAKKAFTTAGSYNENMVSGEDWDLFSRMRKMGYTYGRNTSFIDHQLGNLKFWDYVKKKKYYGKHIKKYMMRNKQDIVAKIPLFRGAYFRNWRKLVHHPLLTSGFLLMKTFESIFLILGMLEGEQKANNKNN